MGQSQPGMSFPLTRISPEIVCCISNTLFVCPSGCSAFGLRLVGKPLWLFAFSTFAAIKQLLPVNQLPPVSSVHSRNLRFHSQLFCIRSH